MSRMWRIYEHVSNRDRDLERGYAMAFPLPSPKIMAGARSSKGVPTKILRTNYSDRVRRVSAPGSAQRRADEMRSTKILDTPGRPCFVADRHVVDEAAVTLKDALPTTRQP